MIQGVQPSTLEDLGMPRQRDPDALPPRNVFDWAMSVLYYAAASCAHGNVLFALKAGIFSVALCLPSFIKSSSTFAYGKWILFFIHSKTLISFSCLENRFVWGMWVSIACEYGLKRTLILVSWGSFRSPDLEGTQHSHWRPVSSVHLLVVC